MEDGCSMDLLDKLAILTDAAKYDVACTSSGVDRPGQPGKTGSAVAAGICHSFAADGRCISLLKVLMSNQCIYDCKYCVNRVSRDTPRTAFTPQELADLTMSFYRRNYIEGLFLSSGVMKSPDYTTERMIQAIELLRNQHHFNGYIHVKAIPGTDNALLQRMGLLADRMSVNIELPSESGLEQLAPQKKPEAILRPMGLIRAGIEENTSDLTLYRHAPKFVPAGQSTQLIIGATPDSDHRILSLSEGLYNKYKLKRVFFSAYNPVVEDPLLPSVFSAPPLLREHRLYQADWLMRFYGFTAGEIVDAGSPNMNLAIDPKCNWALRHMDEFPVEVNRASYEKLLRVPGIGVLSAKKILQARRAGSLNFDGLKKLGVVLKRAKFFITCQGKVSEGAVVEPDTILRGLLSGNDLKMLPAAAGEQMAFTDIPDIARVMGGVPVSAFGYLPEEREKQNAGQYEFGIHI
jgi:putative DNA modification/repair radical SAM protein